MLTGDSTVGEMGQGLRWLKLRCIAQWKYEMKLKMIFGEVLNERMKEEGEAW